jgi:hypothetical protein
MTASFRLHRESILNSIYQNQNILPLSETFERTDMERVLTQTGCTAVRIYYGMDEDLKTHAIFVGVNADNEDMIAPATQTLTEEESDEDLLLEGGVRCPEICPPESELNG